jgi:alpha-beta hydrolase superfamily lysophospholipase
MMYTTGIPSANDYANPTVYWSAAAPTPAPGVVAIPGYTEAQSAINQWGTFLASHGFIVMMVDTATNGAANAVTPLPPDRANGLMEGVKTLQAENTRSGSPIAGKLDTTRMVVMGHSMGGGGTLIAASGSSAQDANLVSSLKGAIGLCPWNSSPNSYQNDKVPSLMFDGTADGLVSVGAGGMATQEFASIPTSTSKMYVEYNGGSHFVANTPLGGAATDVDTARIGLSWLEVHVMGDMRYAQFLVKDAATMSNFTLNP